MTGVDLTGRTRGAGTVFGVVGKGYMWITNQDGKLEAVSLEKLAQTASALKDALPGARA